MPPSTNLLATNLLAAMPGPGSRITTGSPSRTPVPHRARLALLTEDEHAVPVLERALTHRDLRTVCVPHRTDPTRYLRGVDLVIVDVSGGPGSGAIREPDAVEVCHRIHRVRAVPVIVLSDRATATERARALDAGATDYLTTPYGLNELIARVRAVLRRTAPGVAVAPPDVLVTSTLQMDLIRRHASIDSSPVRLTPTEFTILARLVAARGAVCPRTQLIEQIWGSRWPGADDTLTVHVGTLRTKLRPAGAIRTVRGIGYRWEDQADPLRTGTVSSGARP